MTLTTQYICSSVEPIAINEKSIGAGEVTRQFITGEDESSSSPARPTKPYKQSEWVYICVNLIRKAASSIQCMLSTLGPDEVIESGQAYEFLFRQKGYPFSRFLSDTVGYFSLFNTAYWVFDEMIGSRPLSIKVLSPLQLKPLIENNTHFGWLFLGKNGHREALPLEVVHPIVDFNPDSEYVGVGPAEVGKLSISSSYQANLFNEASMFNGGKIGNVVTFPQHLEDTEIRMYRSQIEARHKGANNAGRTMVLAGGGDVKSFGQTMVELDMLNLRQFDAHTICALFNVPWELVFGTEAQYAGGPAQQRFISDNICGLLDTIADNITMGILPRFKTKPQGLSIKSCKTYRGTMPSLKHHSGYRTQAIKAAQSQADLFAWFAVDDHPAMQAAKRDMADKAAIWHGEGVPLNNLIRTYDLPFEEVPWGDDVLVPMGQTTARYLVQADPLELTGQSLPEGDTGDDHDQEDEEEKGLGYIVREEHKANQQLLKLWRNWIASWAGLEKEYIGTLRSYFVRQQRSLIKILKKAIAEKSIDSTITKDATDNIIARVVFDIKEEDGRLRIINNTFYEKASELGIRQGLTETGTTEDQLEDAVEPIKQSQRVRYNGIHSAHNLKGINRVTQDKIAKQLRAGLDAGENLQQLSSRINEVLGGNRARAMRIARTQTAGAISTGRHASFQASGVKGKSWITSGDTHVRETHKAAGVNYASPIALDVYFEVGGANMMHPGDPSAPVKEIVNCRCLEIARALASKSIDFNINFYSYAKMLKAKTA